MFQTLSRLIAAWPLVARRSLSHWKLLSSVIIGVLLASAIMAGTSIYFDSLRGLALENTLAKLTTTEKDIVIKADRGPTSYREFNRVSKVVNREIDSRVAWLLRDRIRGGKTATFFLTAPGNEGMAGEDNSRAYFAYLPRLLEHITLLRGGRLPQEQALSAPDEPLLLEAIIPVQAAEQFGVGVGDRLSAVPYWTDKTPHAVVVISGIFDRNRPGDEFWHLNDKIFQASTSGSFRTVPFYISEKTFMEVLGGAFRTMDSTYGWLLAVEPARLNARNSTLARVNIQLMRKRLATNLFSYRQITSLDEALEDYDLRLFFSKLPMLIIMILIAVVILYYVITLSSLLVDQQRGEIALLRSRGATSAQVLVVFVLEGATISVLAIVVAPLLAATVISVLGFTPAFSALSGNDRLPVAISPGAYMMSALGGILSFAALMIPAVQASRIGVTRHRQEAARPASQSFFQRYYLDVMLLAVSVLLFRQLTEQGSVVAVGVFGEVAVNQVLLAVPALILVAFALVLLRLFPLSIRFVSGDSPALVHLVVAGTVIILGPSVAIRGAFDAGGLTWLAQVALIAALAGAYWATDRTRRNVPLKLAGLAIQAALVASIILVGPSLPRPLVFVPILILIVPAQALFMVFRAMARRAPVGFTLGMWQMARNPTHYARLSLLLILMAGLGILAASFGATLERSFDERARYSTGADVRVEGLLLNNRGATRPLVKSFQEIPGVERVTPAFRGFGSDLSKLLGEGYQMFAIDGEAFRELAWFRDDFSQKPMAELLSSLDHPGPPQGIVLPDGASRIGVLVKADRPHPTVAVTVRIRDANDRYFTYFLGTLTSSDWLNLDSGLVRRSRFRNRAALQPVHPLTLVSLSFHETDGRNRLRAGSVSIDYISVQRADSEVEIIEPFDDTSTWNILRVVPQAVSDAWQQSDSADDGDSGPATFIWGEGRPLTSRGIFHGPPVSPLPVLATKSFLRDTNHRLGEELEVSVQGHRVQVRLLDTVDYFPTLDTLNRSDGFLISDMASLFRYANLETTSGELRPNEVWISTNGDGTERLQLIDRLNRDEPFPSRIVHDRAASLEESRVDPLVEAGWRALLFIAFSAVLILSGLGFLVHAYVSFRTREVQFALMRTIGFSMRQLITLVWLEQTLVIAAGLALGTWMGRELGSIVMPFLGHDDRGSQVLPPFILEVSWGTLAITYAAMAFVFATIVVGVIFFIRKISLQRILRLGEM